MAKKGLPLVTENYSDLRRFVEDYASQHDTRPSKLPKIYTGVSGTIDLLLEIIRGIEKRGEPKGDYNQVGGLCIIPDRLKDKYEIRTTWGAGIDGITLEDIELLQKAPR